MVGRIVLVMAEYTVDDSPLWYRGSRDLVGQVDAEELGLSTVLRDDLRAWNDVFDAFGEPEFAWPSIDVMRALGLRTAGRLQSDVGTDAQVVFLGGAAWPYRHDETD